MNHMKSIAMIIVLMPSSAEDQAAALLLGPDL